MNETVGNCLGLTYPSAFVGAMFLFLCEIIFFTIPGFKLAPLSLLECLGACYITHWAKMDYIHILLNHPYTGMFNQESSLY